MGGQKWCTLELGFFCRFCSWGLELFYLFYLWVFSWGIDIIIRFIGVIRVVEYIRRRRLTSFKTILNPLRILLKMTLNLPHLIITTKNTRFLLELFSNFLIHSLIIHNLILLKSIILLLITIIIRFILLLF